MNRTNIILNFIYLKTKKMNEIIVQRNNNSHLAKINIEQMFKIKMKTEQPTTSQVNIIS